MIRSLKLQTAILLISLVGVLIFQSIMSNRALESVEGSNEKLTQSFRDLGAINALERDLLALQSIVLIYKETGSRISQTRFDNLMKNIWENIGFLLVTDAPEIDERQKQTQDIIRRMEQHLRDYHSNFQIVMESRSNRARLLSDNIDSRFDQLKSITPSEVPAGTQGESRVFEHLVTARMWAYRYLLTPEPGHERQFQEHIEALKTELSSTQQADPVTVALVDTLKQDFSRLTQVTRGYTYLVNVVMAGSANEFLFSTSELRGIYEAHLQQVNTEVTETSTATRRMIVVVSAACISIAAAMAGFILLNILQPIYRITNVFRRLSAGEEVADIPGVQRNNEIGHLARAANIFRQKNLQTETLLHQSEQLNTDLQELNVAITHEKERAEAATRAKSEFLANMSHEIRTPMNAVKGLVELALATEDEQKRIHYLQKVAYSGGVMLNVINDILDYSKLEAGKLTIESTRFSLGTLIDNFIAIISHQAFEKGLNMEVRVGPGVPEYVIGDPFRISQILLNLVSNAIKFTPEGYVIISIDITENEGRSELTIEVQDSGIGMDDQQVSRIFESFGQADGSISRGYGGTGLGLSIVKNLVELMGGTISTTSSPGVGTTFYATVNITQCNSPRLIALHPDGGICLITDTPKALAWTLSDTPGVKVEQVTLEDTLEGAPGPAGIRPAHSLIIDLSSQALMENYESCINDFYNRNEDRVGFICRPTDEQTVALIRSRYREARILRHPYSPDELTAFLHSVSGKQPDYTGSDVSVEPVSDTEQPMPRFAGHVLLVEDNEINQLVAGEVLEGLGVTFDIAENGKIAVEMVNAQDYDLILMDIQMPVMDGYEATEKIRSSGKTTPICALSANVMKNEIETARDAGIDAYLTKPLEIEELIDCLKRFLTAHRAP